MIRQLLKLFFILALVSSAYTPSHAATITEMAVNDWGQPQISLEGETVLRISNAAGLQLTIYNVTGVQVLVARIDSQDKTINLNLTKGCYIVKVGKVVRKIFIN